MDCESINIWLIGETSPNIPLENGLPSARDMLKKYFFEHSVLRKSKPNSIIAVAKEVCQIWDFHNETAIDGKDVVKKMKKVIKKYENLKKSRNRRTSIQRNHETSFEEFLDRRFDIAPKENYHRSKPGPKPKIYVTPKEKEEVDDINSDTESPVSDFSNDMDFETTLSAYQISKLSIDVKASNFVENSMKSADVFSTLDRIGLSNTKFTMLCASMARASDINLEDCVLSSDTVRRRRIVNRGNITTIIKDEFSSTNKSALVVHWDGKKLKDTTNEDKKFRNKLVERLAVVVEGVDKEKIITIAKAENGTGIIAAETVYENLKEWNVLQWIVASCTDTTSANTGPYNGAVVLFENLMKKNLVYFACRHHIFELVIGAVFVMLFGDTTAPSSSMFDNFKRDWILVDQTKFEVKKNFLFSLCKSSRNNFPFSAVEHGHFQEE